MVGVAILAVVIATSIWAYRDSRTLGAGQLGSPSRLDPIGWFVFCLVLWIIAFPLYLMKRTDLKTAHLAEPWPAQSALKRIAKKSTDPKAALRSESRPTRRLWRAFGRQEGTTMASYYVVKDGKQAGPFEETEVLRRIEEGLLSCYDVCWRESMADWQPIAIVLNVTPQRLSPPPIPATSAHAAEETAALFLHISMGRLILMSIASFSLYEAYWIYKNWRFVKERDNLTIRPFWRGVFGVFYCHSLLRRIHEDKEARSVQAPLFSPGGLATGWVVLIILGNLISYAPAVAASIVGAFIPSFLCLVPVQNYVNAVSARRSPGQPYYRWSSGHVLCLVLGIIVWAILLICLGSE